MSSPARDREPYIHPKPSTPPRSPSPITSNAPRTPSPSSPRPSPQPSQPTLGSDPLLNVVPALLSPSPLPVPSRHSHSLSPVRDREPYVRPELSTSPRPPSSITSNTARTPSPPSPQPPSQPPQSTSGVDPLLIVVPGLVSPSPSSVPARHSRSLSSSLGNVHPPHPTASVDDTLAETPFESATHSIVRRPPIDEEDD
ncbi:hypothetical protein BDN67DRAFT_267655 [Paxillus ammoniavirescens]|nr:hypothetical protein BDN67DRAFT_267655 [Paxillus ammoniavirescens]